MTRILTSLVLSLPLIGAYAIFALGIVLIYRASRMLNLAHGAMAMLPAYLLRSMVVAGVPTAVAFPLAVASGALLGFAVERIFVTRLRADGPTAQTVGTVAALGLIVAVSARVWGTSSLSAVRIFPAGRLKVGLSSIQYGEIGLFLVMLVVGAVLYLVIQRTDMGLMMRGTAESRLAASLMGVNPARITSFTWMLGGALAALAGIMLASVTSLQPYTLTLQALPAFIAALLGGLGSLPGALIGAAIVGVTQALVPAIDFLGHLEGAPQLLLTILAIAVMAVRGKRMAAGGDDDADTRATGPAAAKSASGGTVRSRKPAARPGPVIAGVAALVAFPYLPGVSSSLVATANLAVIYATIGVSLVLLTGWVGQISLGHAALVGVGAYATGHVVEGLGVPFPFSLPLGAAAAALAAALLGIVALRVRGLYLAVATLVFSWMASEFLFRQRWFIKHSQVQGRAIGEPGTLPFFDFTDRRTFFLIAVAVLAIVVFAAANVRDSKSGRAFFAIRGSEMAAASLGIDVMRYKLLAFVFSGAIAGAAGNLILTDARVVTADQFTFNISLFFVAVAVVGGLTSLPGAVASGVLFAGLSEVFYRVRSLGAFLEITSNLLLAVTLIAYSGGLASLPPRLRAAAERARPRVQPLFDAVRQRLTRPPREASVDLDAAPKEKAVVVSRMSMLGRWVRERIQQTPLGGLARQPEEAEPPLDFREIVASMAAASTNGDQPATTEPAVEPAAEGPAVVHETTLEALQLGATALFEVRPTGDREGRRPLIEAAGVTVRFGGLTAVNNASLTVREREIVGLIGPNGAGKTTLFNAIAGYNSPAEGVIRLYGRDVTDLPVHRRARVGVARTFQLIQLFRELTVFENLMVATHVHNPTGFGSHLVVSKRSVDDELAAVERVEHILDLLDLRQLGNRRAGDLPFGVLRMIEVARALVTGFRVIMLDEPASGLDNAETDKLIEVLQFVRGLGVTLLLIEHDVRMVTGVSDYLYVLDQGRIIAEGVSADIQRNPDVIAAYLGEPAEAVAI